MGMNHTEWLEQTAGDDSPREIEVKTGVPYRTVQNQRSNNRFSAENVIKIAIGYGAHPVGALVDTGYLDAKYAKTVDPAIAIRLVTEDQLADEVLRRMKIGPDTDALTTPIDDLAARRSNMPAPGVDWAAYGVADSSPEEGEGHPGDYEP